MCICVRSSVMRRRTRARACDMAFDKRHIRHIPHTNDTIPNGEHMFSCVRCLIASRRDHMDQAFKRVPRHVLALDLFSGSRQNKFNRNVYNLTNGW